ncbi:single-strand DNA endonuclease 1-like isoform X1 [Quercus robur]|uniref:single-strand DNA endonuclease 1-like isoform X1 n=2 Tax=Quercus robur TaxID=38942 RepID=UPI002161F9D7|nr:single-strand DNA endonuclease 1-like isoform X1 [Quercus robur]
MGVKNLWDILESCKKTLPLHHLQNKRVCIDLSCWMVQLQNVSKSHSCMKEKVYLRGLFHRLRALIAVNCTIVFVTDGSIPAIKLSTYRRRLNSGSEVTQDDRNLQNVTSLRRNMGSEFSCMIKEAKVLGMALGIACLDGIEEAEAQCALLNSESLCDGCFTSDSDVFLFGARTVYRDICLGDGGYVTCYEMTDVERQLGFGRNSLITLALLLGCDYSQGVHGLGPESACQIVKSVGDNVVLQKVASEGLSFVKKKRSSKKQGAVSKCNNSKENSLDHDMNVNGSKHDSQRDDQHLQVIDAYLKPKCHSADSDAVHRALAQYPFQRAKLQQICAQFFEWPLDKTDEYILPKIAERNLRRFCNLRSTSSDLELKLPLHKIPVKCPVSKIIKHRKVQGRDCYEVSWEDLDGLKTSIVPADLVESACPEKIVEFEEERAERKKQNHRKTGPKKSEKGSSVTEIDLKLQRLLLDIELESSSVHNASFSSNVEISESRTAAPEVDLTNQDLWLDPKSSDDISCNEVGPSTAKSEVIDLLSPSPPRQSCMVSKFPKSNGPCIDVIDLSESETDVSPEHERKARELRLFLASIRDEIS